MKSSCGLDLSEVMAEDSGRVPKVSTLKPHVMPALTVNLINPDQTITHLEDDSRVSPSGGQGTSFINTERKNPISTNRSRVKDDISLTSPVNKLFQPQPQHVPNQTNVKVAQKNQKSLATIRSNSALGQGSSFQKRNDDFLDFKIPLGQTRIAEKFQPAFGQKRSRPSLGKTVEVPQEAPVPRRSAEEQASILTAVL